MVGVEFLLGVGFGGCFGWLGGYTTDPTLIVGRRGVCFGLVSGETLSVRI